MNYEIILVAVALAMDAFAVALSSGMTIPRVKLIHALKIGGVFGLFQGVMPVIGYLGGTLFAKQISAIDHWVAFVLLAIIGGKMIHEAFANKEKLRCEKRDDWFAKNRVDYCQVTTHEGYVEPLVKFFRKREKRR